MIALYILLALAVLKIIVWHRVYHSLPLAELKRRARTHDKRYISLYKAAAYGAELDTFLWICGTVLAAVLVIWSARTDWWLAAIVMVVLAWLTVWGPRFSAEGWAGGFVGFFSPALAWFLSLLHPVLRQLAKLLPTGHYTDKHTDLYEKKDFLEFITKQRHQPDSRISKMDLDIAKNALDFGDKLVRSVMAPRNELKLVAANETVGPMLMDELHKSGHKRFPVVKDSSKSAQLEIVGTLYLNDLIGYEGGGKVKDLAEKKVYFINEDSNLRQALDAFLKTHHHMLVVVNNFEEVAGALSLEDVLEQILGKQIISEFDAYENMRAVAAMDVKPGENEHIETQPEQSSESVVE